MRCDLLRPCKCGADVDRLYIYETIVDHQKIVGIWCMVCGRDRRAATVEEAIKLWNEERSEDET